MWLNRTISIAEFDTLMAGEMIYGKYDISQEKKADANCSTDVVSFFIDDFWWIDEIGDDHLICIEANIDESRIIKGVGTYHIPEANYNDIQDGSKLWTGIDGDCEIKLKEGYLPYYSLEDVTGFGFAYFDDPAVDNVLDEKKDKVLKAGLDVIPVPDIEYYSTMC